MARPLVRDIAHVVGIETVRSAELVVDGSDAAKSALDRVFGLRPGLVEFSPAKFPP